MHEQQTDIRIGDAERDAVADRLRQAHAEGRLNTEELQERIGRCYQARTERQLAALVGDLPAVKPAHAQVVAASGYPRRWLIRILPVLLAVWLVSAVVHWHVLWFVVMVVLVARLLSRRRRGPFGSWPVGGSGHVA